MSQLRGHAIATLLSAPVQRALGRAIHLGRRLRGGASGAVFAYQVDDPYSHLLAQAVQRLADRTDWSFLLVPPPADDVDPKPELRRRWAARDARWLADRFDVWMPAGPELPDPGAIAVANRILAVDRPFTDQLAAALTVGDALWGGEPLAEHAAQLGTADPTERLAANHARLQALGHYHGGTVHLGGTTYWGLDRLAHLETALDRAAGTPRPSVLGRRPDPPPAPLVPPGEPLELELFFSFRSPYSYLALDRAYSLAERYPVTLRIRPVLPMVMRGLQVPRSKRLYIVLDSKREADRLGIPFGRICDPLGVGVERCLAVVERAEAAGKGAAFVRSAATGIWSEALDVARDRDLRRVVERAGLEWADVVDVLGTDHWRAMTTSNAEALLATGLWGVPTFRIAGLTVWGQDRITRIEDALRGHVAA